MKRKLAFLSGMIWAKGVALWVAPHAYLRFLSHEDMPRWVREQAEPWTNVPEANLRRVGMGMMIWSMVMLHLSHCMGWHHGRGHGCLCGRGHGHGCCCGQGHGHGEGCTCGHEHHDTAAA